MKRYFFCVMIMMSLYGYSGDQKTTTYGTSGNNDSGSSEMQEVSLEDGQRQAAFSAYKSLNGIPGLRGTSSSTATQYTKEDDFEYKHIPNESCLQWLGRIFCGCRKKQKNGQVYYTDTSDYSNLL